MTSQTRPQDSPFFAAGPALSTVGEGGGEIVGHHIQRWDYSSSSSSQGEKFTNDETQQQERECNPRLHWPLVSHRQHPRHHLLLVKLLIIIRDNHRVILKCFRHLRTRVFHRPCPFFRQEFSSLDDGVNYILRKFSLFSRDGSLAQEI